MFDWLKRKKDTEEIIEKHQIYFLSCRVREMNTDLRPLSEHLSEKADTSVFSFVRDNNKGMIPNPVTPLFSLPETTEAEDAAATEKTYAAICNDIAMRDYFPERREDTRQILLITSNNFFYQIAMKEPPEKEDPKRLDLEKFTHILAPNPFIADMITRNYDLEDTQTLQLLENPYHWNLRQEETIQKMKEDFLEKYPQAKEKKILFFMLPKKTGKAQKEIYEQFPLDTFLSSLGEDWLFVTNYKPLLIRTMGMRKDYTEQFLYLNRQYPLENILYFCDSLVTDLAFLATAQAQREKPFFCISHNDNAFELYVKENHPALFLETPDDLFHLCNLSTQLTEEHMNFYQEITFKQEQNPMDELTQLLLLE